MLDLFPTEITCRILSYLTARDLVLSVSPVSTLWYELSQVDYLWRPLCLQQWGYLKRTFDQLKTPSIPWLEFFRSNLDRSNLSFLVIGSEGGLEKDDRLNDVKAKIMSCGVMNVDTFNARISIPTYEMLSKYNAILFFSYYGFNQEHFGNLLAQYVDNGGGVVIGTYSNCGRGNRLEGKWCAGQYDPLTVGSTSRTKALRLAKCDIDHPIMHGVKSFNGGIQSSHGDGKAHPDASVIAEWSNGRPLITELSKFNGAVVGLNFYPPSSDIAEGCWDPASDGHLIITNALCYVTSTKRL